MSVTLETLKEVLCGADGSQGIIQDSSYYSGITARINKAQRRIAAGIRMPKGTDSPGVVSPPLPGLLDTDTVDTATDAAYVSLPSDYQRNVIMVADSNGDQIHPPKGGNYHSFDLFMKRADIKDLTETGDIYIVCVTGSRLYYQGISSASKTLTLMFYRAPTDMSDDEDTVDGLPDHLAEDLIKHYVARDIFGEGLEDSDESRKTGYTYHSGRLYEVITDLIDFVGLPTEAVYYDTTGEDEEW